MAYPDVSSSTVTVDKKPADKKPAAKKAKRPKEPAIAKPKGSPLSGVIQGGREVTVRELNSGVSRRPDDPLELGPADRKLNDRLSSLLKDLTELREDAYNAGNRPVAQIAKAAEREIRVSAAGYVRFDAAEADQRPEKKDAKDS